MFEDKDKIFIKENSTIYSINELYNLLKRKYTIKQIRNYCNNNNLIYRKLTLCERGESLKGKNRVLPQRQQTPINHDYFKTWSRNMAYIFGLWCADGFIKNQNNGYYFSIKLHKNDKYLLQQILDEMQSEHKIYENNEGCCHITFSSKTIYNDIIKLGGVEKKSLILKFPNVRDEFIFDFIRGYFDGDGCVSMVKNGYILGTKDFCDKLNDILKNNNIHSSCIRQKHPEYGADNNCYILGLYKKDEFKKFASLVYYNINENILYLKRKKERV